MGFIQRLKLGYQHGAAVREADQKERAARKKKEDEAELKRDLRRPSPMMKKVGYHTAPLVKGAEKAGKGVVAVGKAAGKMAENVGKEMNAPKKGQKRPKQAPRQQGPRLRGIDLSPQGSSGERDPFFGGSGGLKDPLKVSGGKKGGGIL